MSRRISKQFWMVMTPRKPADIEQMSPGKLCLTVCMELFNQLNQQAPLTTQKETASQRTFQVRHYG